MQMKSIDVLSLRDRLDEENLVLVDVREPHEHAREYIEGARLVPLSRFQAEDFGTVRDKIAVFHCQSGGRTGANARLLMSKGFGDLYHLKGGITAWKAAGLPTRTAQAGSGGRKRLGWLF